MPPTKRPVLLSLLALAVTFLATLAALVAWIEYIPPDPAPSPRPSASSAYTAALEEMRKLSQLPKPRHPLYSRVEGVPVDRIRDRWQPHFQRIRALHGQVWDPPAAHAAPSGIPGEDAPIGRRNPSNPGRFTVTLEYSRLIGIEAEALRALNRTPEALDAALEGMRTAAHLSRGTDTVRRLHVHALHQWSFREAARSLDGAADAPAVLHRTRTIRREWQPLAVSMRLNQQRQTALLRFAFRDFAKRSLRERKELIGSLGIGSPWDRLRVVLTPRSASLDAVVAHAREWERQLQLPHRRRREPAPISDPMAALCITGEPTLAQLVAAETPQTDLALLEVALAARIYRKRSGRFPNSLAELQPGLLPAVPLDQWDTPVVYRLKNGKPLIYSLGPDGDDDGGRPIPPESVGDPNADGDCVFGRQNP